MTKPVRPNAHAEEEFRYYIQRYERETRGLAHGLDLRLFVEQLFANRVSAFFAMDVIVSSVVLWFFVWIEGRREGVKRLWAPIAASLAVGVSLGLPLFLYLRERR